MRRGAWLAGLVLCCLSTWVAGQGKVTPQQINDAIESGVDYLKRRQQDGWETDGSQMGQDTGVTAIATYALLAAGEKPNDPSVAKGIEFLRKNQATGVYALGLRAQVWASLGPTKENRAAMAADLRALNLAQRTRNEASGMFHYWAERADRDDDMYDHSCSQFGVLGFWAMARSGMEVDGRVWRLADAGWRKHQNADGGWGYTMRMGQSTLSMTAAGVASLYITQDYVRNFAACNGNVVDANLDRGLKWLGDHYGEFGLYQEPEGFGRPFRPRRPRPGPYELYTQFGLSRIGIVSGRKYFGDHDWFNEGAARLISLQGQDGSWGGIPDTAFGVLFLARGSAPVIIQKLQYRVTNGTKEVEGPWQQRPRDVANLVSWMGRQMERNFNWQTTPLDVSVDTLHDAPILYIGGHQTLSFTPEQRDKLRQFVEEGGLILGHADCGSAVFTQSFKELGVALFPSYEFRELPKDHAIYTSDTIQYQPSKWPQRPSVMGLGNGVRELMLLIPTADAAKAWQFNDDKAKAEMFQLASNIVLYATDNKPISKGNTYLVKPDVNQPVERKITVARLSYGGNWDPEPAGWRRLAAILRNRSKIDLQVEPVKLGEGKLHGYKIAHLTGTTAITINDAMRDELKDFLAAGGTLIVDAAGGSAAFTTSVEDELPALLPVGGVKALMPLPADHPVYVKALGKPADAQFRFWARTKFAMRTDKPQIRGYEVGGRIAVFFSPSDLSGGLVGQSMDGINGYSPASAVTLMTAMLLN